jgi:hypothetical protein
VLFFFVTKSSKQMSDNEDDDVSQSNLEGEFDQLTFIWGCDGLNVIVQTDNVDKKTTGWTFAYCPQPHSIGSPVLQDCECGESPGTWHETPRKQCLSLPG